MSLSIQAGMLSYLGKIGDADGARVMRRDFVAINKVLTANHLPRHAEPEVLELSDQRGDLSFPYLWLHYLRRAVAHARSGARKLIALSDKHDPREDARLDREQYGLMESHVIYHSDTEGYYVPIEFDDPICETDQFPIPGGILGSSQRALVELVQTAPLIGIPVTSGRLTEVAAQAIEREAEGASHFFIERKVWLAFYCAASLSAGHGTAIAFT